MTPAFLWGKKHQELRTDQASGVYIPHSGVPQNQGQHNSEVAGLLLHFFLGVQFWCCQDAHFHLDCVGLL